MVDNLVKLIMVDGLLNVLILLLATVYQLEEVYLDLVLITYMGLCVVGLPIMVLVTALQRQHVLHLLLPALK